MATSRRPRTKAAAAPSDPFLGQHTVVPGEVLLTLSPDAAESMTASVPTHPAGPVLGSASALGVAELDAVLADLGAHDITRLALPTLTPGLGADVLGTPPEDHLLGRTFRVRIAADTDVTDAVGRLAAVSGVEIAEPNRYRVTYDLTPNDPQFPQQWGLAKINAPAAWSRTTGSPDVVVGVIDSGIDLSHPELAPLLVPGYDMVDFGPNPVAPDGYRFEGDFSGRDSVPLDEVGHGTHVAGTIAALSNNAVGVAGVTWQCRIQPVKALTRVVRIKDGMVGGIGTSADVAAAVRWAADNGSSIINMSLGSPEPTSVEKSAIAYAIGKGVVVVAAMGNGGTSKPSYPAAYPDVVSVGAVDSADKKTTFSQWGPHIDVVAPGITIMSTIPGGYGQMSGTSMASPHVAGVAALIRSVKPDATVAQVTEILRTTARALRDAASDPVPNDRYGWGLVDAAAAVAQASPTVLRTSRAICELPLTRGVECVMRTSPAWCGLPLSAPEVCRQPRTIMEPGCLPRTQNPACGAIYTALTCPPETIGNPVTTRVVDPIRTVRRGFAGSAAYDPYGYFGEPDAAASEWQAGYEAGYAAAWTALQQDQTAGAQGEADVAATDAPPYPWTLPPACPVFRTPKCPPVSALCPTRNPHCPPYTPLCPPATRWCPVRTPYCEAGPITHTTLPTTPMLGGGGWEAGVADPYGQTPFQG